MAADGTGKTKLFDTTANETYPRYIPGTNKIMFMSDKTGNNKLYTIDTNGNTTTIKMISR
jgi:Tol biopolymer transport system component